MSTITPDFKCSKQSSHGREERIECDVKQKLDNMIQVKGETYSDIIKRVIDEFKV